MPTEPIEVMPFQFYDPGKPMTGVMDFRPNPIAVKKDEPEKILLEEEATVCDECLHELSDHDSETGCANCDCSFTGTTTSKVETTPPIV